MPTIHDVRPPAGVAGRPTAPTPEGAGRSPAPAAGVAGQAPAARPAPRPEVRELPPEFEIDRGLIPGFGDGSDEPPARAAGAPEPPAVPAPPKVEFMNEDLEEPRARPLRRPVFVYADDPIEAEKPSALRTGIERLARDPRLLAILLIALIGTAAYLNHRAQNAGITPLRAIRKDSRAFDGQTVKVKGRVGEVFPIGSSYAYNLHQGRDTLVIFTRSRVPVTNERVVVEGAISTGELEGVPRPALFEGP